MARGVLDSGRRKRERPDREKRIWGDAIKGREVGDMMVLSDEERIDAKVEELDELVAALQRRRQELLGAKETKVGTPSAPKMATSGPKAPSKTEKAPQPAARVAGQNEPKSPLNGTLDSLPWKSFKKKEGEWAFLRDREGRLIDELQSAREFVDRVRKEGEVVVGKYRYVISEDKFLNRYYEAAKAT